MFFHILIFLYSIIYLVIVEFATTDFVNEKLAAFLEKGLWVEVLVFLLFFVYFFQVAKSISKKISMTPIPMLFIISSIGLMYFAQSGKQQQTLIILCTILYYFIHLALHRMRSYESDQTAHGLLAAGGIATIFLFYSTSYGIYLNFNIPLSMFMLSIMAVTSIISYQYFSSIKKENKNVLSYSAVLGFVMAEIVWVLNFWPFGYLTTGAVSLIFYYVFWDLVQGHFLNELSKKKVIVNIVIFGLLIALILASAKWLPVV